jgi:hypothetical protein
MRNNQIKHVENHAKKVLSDRNNAPTGTDRSAYVSVDYSAVGKFEAVTLTGGRDYLAAEEILAWRTN